MIINVQEFKKVLSLAGPFLMTQDFIPILQHFWFRNNTIMAYNDIQAIKLEFNTQLNCAVPGILLVKVLNTLSQTDVEIKIDSSATNLLIGEGRNQTRIPIMSADNFIFEMPNLDGLTFTVENSFHTGLEKCLKVVSHDPTKPERNGVTCKITKDVLTLYASDGIAIAKYQQPGSYQVDDLEEIVCIIPTFFCEQLTTLLKNSKAGATITLTPDSILAEINNDQIFSKVINASIPKFEQAIQKVIQGHLSDLTYIPVPLELESFMERAKIMLQPEKGIKYTTIILKRSGEIQFKTSSDKGRSYDEIESPFVRDSDETHQTNPTHLQIACMLCNEYVLHNGVFIFRHSEQEFWLLVSMR